MSTSVPEAPRATRAQVTGDLLVVELEAGRIIQVPLEWFPRLSAANERARQNLRLIGRGIGIHWPDLDEDISVAGLLRPSLAASLRLRQEPDSSRPHSG